MSPYVHICWRNAGWHLDGNLLFYWCLNAITPLDLLSVSFKFPVETSGHEDTASARRHARKFLPRISILHHSMRTHLCPAVCVLRSVVQQPVRGGPSISLYIPVVDLPQVSYLDLPGFTSSDNLCRLFFVGYVL